MNDLLENRTREIKIGPEGVVRLIDCMPRVVDPGENFDHAVCQAARVSYGANEKKPDEAVNRGLIRYLMRHHHGTPFEMVDIKFYMALPIFVARQLIRHRMASVNEYSMRYKQPTERCFIPEVGEVRKQSKNNKQGSEGQIEVEAAAGFIDYTKSTFEAAFEQYEKYEKIGVGREIARINLPLSTFTEWYWEIDLRNLLGFLYLRLDGHAQKEIRDYANAIYDLVKPLMPYTAEAFEDFSLNSIQLSALEIDAIRSLLPNLYNLDYHEQIANDGTGRSVPKLDPRSTERERQEFAAKCIKLGIVDGHHG